MTKNNKIKFYLGGAKEVRNYCLLVRQIDTDIFGGKLADSIKMKKYTSFDLNYTSEFDYSEMLKASKEIYIKMLINRTFCNI